MTSFETGPTWLERLNPRNWTLVWKLVVVGLAPALLALTIGALRIADQAGDAAQLGRGERLFDARADVAAAGDALRAESYQASLYVAGGRTGDVGPLQAAEAKTDSAVGVLRTATLAGDLDQSATVAVAQAANAFSRLGALRREVTDSPAFALAQVRNTYAQIAEGPDVLDRVLLREIRGPETGGQVDALSAAQAVRAQLATQHMLVGDAIRAEALQPDDRNAVDATDVEIFAQYRTYQLSLTPQQLQKYGTFLDDPADTRREELAGAVLSAPAAQASPVAAADWDTAYTGSQAAVDRSSDLIRQDVRAAGAAAEQQASNLAGINSVILMLGLLIGIGIAILIARSLIRSLRVLRGAALDVAERRLPDVVANMRAGDTPDVTVDPVPINTRDEVGQVARAFDAVHGQAVRLAADQAALQSNVSAMFVNLSRRSQALVERQLQLIEQLESNEQDADQLSNLFQLDHLATRMRRNSENLLVLAGTDLAKRNIAPVPMVDVLRAAVSEVEQYQRVVVQAPPPAAILGRAGSDLVHLLAELLDNATNFSPPDSQVVMSTARTTDGAIVVEIADRGVGMADHELADANQRLSGPATVDVSASRRMGLFVVGRLAARHGIGVRLAGATGHGPAAGLTASVTVPAYLVPKTMPAEVNRPAGVPMGTGVPARSGPPPAKIPLPAPPAPPARPDTADSPSLSALATGDSAATAVERPETTPAGDGLFAGPPATNGVANGLPTRTPGSSLRPDGPGGPPRRVEPFAESRSDDDEGDRVRRVAEQARRDQEAAAQRDRRHQDDAPAVNGHLNGGPPRHEDGQPGPTSLDHDAVGTPGESGGRDTGGGPDAEPRPAGRVTPPPAAPPPTTPIQLVRPAAAAADTTPPAHPTPRPADVPVPPVPATATQADPVAAPQPAPPVAGGVPAAEGSGGGSAAPRGAPAATSGSPSAVVDEFADPWPVARQPEPLRPQPTPRSEAAGAPPTPFGGLGPARASDGADALFAPSLPTTGGDTDIGDLSNSGDDGENTPIFEEIASAWFRSNRPVPVTWQAEPAGSTPAGPTGAAAVPAGATPAGETPEADPSPRPVPPAPTAPVPNAALPNAPIPNAPIPNAPAPEAAPAPSVPSATGVAAPMPVTPDALVARQPSPPIEPRPTVLVPPARSEPLPQSTIADASAFSTPADEGWLAASGIETERADELTAAGLPKRRPRARLVPGSAGSAVLAQPVSAARSAENIRGRLSSYQQGVRQGRESRVRGESDDAADHDQHGEES